MRAKAWLFTVLLGYACATSLLATEGSWLGLGVVVVHSLALANRLAPRGA